MYVWAREVLFLGTCFARQQAHRSTQEKLILNLRGTLQLADASGRLINVRSCIIPSGLWLDETVLNASGAVVGIYHLAPFSQDYAALRTIMTPTTDGVYYGHPNEDEVVRAAIDARDQKHLSAAEARAILRAALFPAEIATGVFRDFDPRIIEVAKCIRDSILVENVSLTKLARDVQLSVSRLEKLFKEQAGLPITQYRMRYRVFISTILMALGYSMTEAALCAGFSNSAHLSRSYRSINGLTPSAMFLKPPHLDPVIDDSAMSLVAPLLAGRVAV